MSLFIVDLPTGGSTSQHRILPYISGSSLLVYLSASFSASSQGEFSRGPILKEIRNLERKIV
jgi:hypothetical protein